MTGACWQHTSGFAAAVLIETINAFAQQSLKPHPAFSDWSLLWQREVFLFQRHWHL
jgi:hypothetical protein